jgi:CDP-glucose 4,6-dehydratase
MHYLITGHTGFKGAWMTFMLSKLGHEISGISLDPIPESLFADSSVSSLLNHDIRSDIRDKEEVFRAFERIKPDIVIHMAAQPLVLESYRNPIDTFEINVNGTLNVLEATRRVKSVQAQVIVTTDKVYKNKNQRRGYVETDELGGEDPYSASKSMADILAQSWIKSFDGPPTAIARAGNVIGGGDVSKDRLIPDLLKSYKSGKSAVLRNPNAVRPWQHVLDCIYGYFKLSEYLLQGGDDTQWNFGPKANEFLEVYRVAEIVGHEWGITTPWIPDSKTNPAEANLLALDSEKARRVLNWHDMYNFEQSVLRTSDWYKKVERGMSKENATIENVQNFLSNYYP